jgi:hypothetical protein
MLAFGCMGEVPFLRDRDKVAKLMNLHRGISAAKGALSKAALGLSPPAFPQNPGGRCVAPILLLLGEAEDLSGQDLAITN